MSRVLLAVCGIALVACNKGLSVDLQPTEPGGTATGTGTGSPTGTATGTGTGSTTYVSPTAPIAADDVGNVDFGGQVDLTPLDNDSDPDGDTLDPATLTIVANPQYGQLTVSPAGNVRYEHDGVPGLTDSFTYTVSDDSPETSNVATVTISVANDAPTANDDVAIVEPGGFLDIAVSSNDVDLDDGLDLASIAIGTAPSNGTAVANADGTVTYTHDGGATTIDSFTYTIADLSGQASNTATVNLTIADDTCIPGSQTFFYTGSSQQFVAPCTGTFTLEAWGAQGQGGAPGLGGYASGDIDLTNGQVLTIEVGGQAGYNGGGSGHAATLRGGGGGSDVRTGVTVNDRVLVAGGGGGGGPTDVGTHQGGHGGDGTCGINYCGGGAGGGYGGAGTVGGTNGGTGNSSTHSGGAGGGGLNSGGAGSCNTGYTNTCGDTGTLGQGGHGDTWENGICFNSYNGTSGGGGGYYGGGGTSVGNCGSGRRRGRQFLDRLVAAPPDDARRPYWGRSGHHQLVIMLRGASPPPPPPTSGP